MKFDELLDKPWGGAVLMLCALLLWILTLPVVVVLIMWWMKVWGLR